ncbi:Hpt domain-containing protein [Pseudomonas coleopterorum]|uniref:Hpt domain-containing protein n=1 Tax=Pseudomonas coleopterorum TaxID=1605838 RepID=A0AAJ6MS15_9PSED|nr:Hpt domain-containing protein [Pseudomonas coleopterorum]WNC08501.1 Hpt domain-containing protein [Pseudomonas coleopterorum]
MNTFDQLQALTGGNRALTRRLLEEVLRSCTDDGQQLLAIAHDDHPRMVDIAHKIHGAARIVQARAVYEACEALEASTAQDDLRPLREALHMALMQLQAELGQTLAELDP